MKKFFQNIIKIYNDFFHPKCEIMIIYFETERNTIECVDWISEPIKQLSGKLTKELWYDIKNYCRKNDLKGKGKWYGGTQVYIWRGMKLKHEYYSERIETFLEDENKILKYIK